MLSGVGLGRPERLLLAHPVDQLEELLRGDDRREPVRALEDDDRLPGVEAGDARAIDPTPLDPAAEEVDLEARISDDPLRLDLQLALLFLEAGLGRRLLLLRLDPGGVAQIGEAHEPERGGPGAVEDEAIGLPEAGRLLLRPALAEPPEAAPDDLNVEADRLRRPGDEDAGGPLRVPPLGEHPHVDDDRELPPVELAEDAMASVVRAQLLVAADPIGPDARGSERGVAVELLA